MADVAFRLARVLLTEIHFNELEFSVDGAGPDEPYQIDVRRATVRRVLESEVAISDETKIARVVEFLPQVIAGEPIPISQITELADLIRNNIPLPDRV